MSSKTSSIGSRLLACFALLLLIALLLSLGNVQRFSFDSARASTTLAFTPGNIVVYRVGDGSGVLGTGAAPVFLDEFTPAGVPVQTIALPTVVGGANKRLTAAGNSTSEGFLTRSTDGNYLVLAGYDAAVGTAAIAGTTSVAANRVIGRVDAAGNVDTSTALTDAISAGNPRGATSTNGTDLWLSGTSAGGGIRYATLGATTSTALTTGGTTNLRATNIFGGQLYVSSASGTTRLVAVGTGTPTTNPQTLNSIPGLDNTNLTGPYAFFFADLDAGVAGVDTLYVADEGANLIKKFSLVGGTWTGNGSIASMLVRGITGNVSGSNVTLAVQSNALTLSTVTDTSGYNATITGTLTTIATAGTNMAFRGVAFAPAAATPTLNVNDVTQAETDAGTTTFTFNVSLTSPAGAGGVSFDIATADGTAQDGVPGGEDNDYVAKSETGRTITAGNSSASFTVTVNGDTTTETNETFFVNVTNVTGATPGDLQGLGTITNDDNVTPTLNVNDVTQAETNAGTTTFTFNVSLTSPALAGGVTFDVATADGTAQDGVPGGEDNDYVAKSETGRTITAGNSSASFTVTVNGDTTTEPNETFFVNVTNITGATAGDVQGLGTITNDDVSATPIHSIQGSGSTSPFVGQVVTTIGIVTGLKSNGFFIQEPDASADADPNTSEGIFVFTSSAPPGSAALGNSVAVTGTVQEFIPSADPTSPPTTELGNSPTTNLLTTGNPLPAPILITAVETTQPSETTNPMDSLEEYEGMRVTVASLTVTGPTQGSINEPNATVTSTGVFLGVVTGVARPFREPGIAISDPVPAPNPPNVPRFDENPERIRVDSDAQPGTTAVDVNAGTVLTNVTGPLDYAFRCYTIDPDAPGILGIGVQPGSIPVPTPNADEFTVASFNMERFFDTVDDAGISDAVLTPAAFARRVTKASLIIRTVQRLPDVIGVEEMENLTTLQAVATQVNSDVVGGGGANPNYQAYLVEGNDVGGIDVGFLVKTSRFTVIDVTQFGLATTYINPNNGQPELLNDRPPLVLRGYIQRVPPGTFTAFTVIVNHLRSLSAIDDAADGNRVRTKRNEQAKFLANLIQARQVADPNEKIITVGDMNAFRVNDGYVDSIGTILGTPAPADQVVLSSSDLVNPNQTDLVDTLSAAQQYSYNFDGNAQTLDHVIVNPPALAILNRFAYARNDSDFAVKNYESTNELRISDHDQPVAYFSLSAPTATNGSITGRITGADGGPISGAVIQVSGTQSRKSITDTNGNYHFDNLETNGFYNVTPSRSNYTFSPANRSFTLVGGRTEATFTASSTGDAANPLEVSEYFVRQQYLDLLGREPDEGGFNYWSDQINQCGNDSGCTSARRRDVAAAFFIEEEFQRTGSFVYGLYKGALGRRPAFLEYFSDRQQVVGGADLETRKQAFAESFVRRTDFIQKYQSNASPESFVDAMVQNLRQSSGVDLGNQRDSLINRYNSGANLEQGRSFVVRDLTESASFRQAEYNAAFVLSEYFSYLRRNPDAGGFDFWLNVLNNSDSGNYRGMVCAFITSTEYQRRFSSVISRGDGECSR